MKKRVGGWVAFGAILTLGCSDGFGPNPEGRLVINNDRVALSQRVHVAPSTPIQISVDRLPGSVQAAPAPFDLVLRADVDPPDADGVILQATDVTFAQPKIFVSYNVEGPMRRGGVDVFYNPSPDELILWSQGVFMDTDVSALAWAPDLLYLATGTSSAGFETPAVLEEIALDNKRLTDRVRRVDLPSFVGTGIQVAGDRVYATSGNGGDPVGGLSVFDRTSLTLVFFDPFPDARAVGVSGETIVAMRGTPAAIRLYNPVPELLNAYPVGGANIPDSKSMVAVGGSLAFIAAGDEGLKVVSLADGTIVQEVPVPEVEGVDPRMAVTNGVAILKDWVFAANGGAGLFAYLAVGNLEEADVVDPQLKLIGQVQFPDGGSANSVWGNGFMIYVANGAGGLRIIEIRPTDHDDMVSP